MTDSTLWIRPTLTPPGPVDAVIFDVDGVLFETSGSFDAAVKATTRDVLTQIYGMTDPCPVTEAELRVFRKAGGLNNDWDMAYVLIALRLAGRANTPKELAAAAAESGGRGRDWAARSCPGGCAWTTIWWCRSSTNTIGAASALSRSLACPPASSLPSRGCGSGR